MWTLFDMSRSVCHLKDYLSFLTLLLLLSPVPKGEGVGLHLACIEILSQRKSRELKTCHWRWARLNSGCNNECNLLSAYLIGWPGAKSSINEQWYEKTAFACPSLWPLYLLWKLSTRETISTRYILDLWHGQLFTGRETNSFHPGHWTIAVS